MKKIIALCIIALTISGGSLFAQDITIPADSIPSLLCKKWEVDYAIMGGMKIGRMPGAAEINYEFRKDKTFILSGSDPKDSKKGTWSYDPKKKQIKLILDGKPSSIISSLKEGELIMLIDTSKATPDDPMPITMVYKIRA